jgi:hypothetical protein
MKKKKKREEKRVEIRATPLALTSGVMRGGLWMATAGIATTDHATE